ncbi:hypothetical protein [Parasitella parasitica]|uniref:MABP1/WDR62 second WD40 domain-containing protein n=1 Tax=Parasitella parasitica TaxID=35722 RepID=A0A0B7NTF8_9FUNG|nr:hypothetical protein [Parasitella parasitica]
MEDQFPVNSGDVAPPSQATNGLSHQLNTSNFQFNTNGTRRKHKETVRSASKLRLERILGLTSTSSNILATANDLIAYAAGAVVVVYNHKRNKQVAFLYPPAVIQLTASNNNSGNANSSNTNQPSSMPLITPLGGGNNSNGEILATSQNNPIDEKKSTPAGNRAKPISCLAFSPDGNYLAAGEMGHQPRIFIWDVKEKKLLREIRSHKFGVLSLTFSPNMRYLVSVGFQHDGYLYVWNWKKGTKLAGNKVTSRVNAVSFAKDGSYFVTAGLRHVKFWYLDARGRIPKRGNLSSRETQVLDGRSGILGVLRDANFVNVACDRSGNTGYTYFITDSGILCIFKEGRVIDKWVDLQVKSAFSIAVSSNYVICTCSEGVIRLFEPVTLKYAGILPKPHPLGTDISLVTSPEMVRPADESTSYPDAIAMVYDETIQRVIAVYSDRSLYVWDIKDLTKIGKYRSFIFHSDCVWGVEPCPTVEHEDNAIPLNSFATFSADGTIRIWNLDNPIHSSSSSPLSPQQQLSRAMSPSSSTAVGAHRRNIYSRELVKMIYADPDAAEFSKVKGDIDFGEDQCPDFGIRSLKMSADGQMMASGDRNGNLRVHDMNSWELLTYQEAHDSEILSIDLTTPRNKDSPSLIATASRDRLLHIFDIKSNFQLVQSLDDHSSSITAVKFSEDANRLISCGADKGIIFRHRTHPVTLFHDAAPRPYSSYHNYSGRSTVFDMALDLNDRYIATVTGERKLYVLSVESGKPFRICRPETSDEVGKASENSGGSLINIDLDPFSGTYAVTSGSDRCIRLFDLTSSSCIEKVCAHSEMITAVRFIQTNTEEDGLRVVSTCSDGTVFVWKVSQEIIAKMCARATERDLKMRQQQKASMEEDKLAHLDEKRDLLLPHNGTRRTRKGSIAAVVRPTASISQMIRQGERKTFSTMSPTEQKYDDLYKKIAISSGRRNNRDNQASANNNIPINTVNTNNNMPFPSHQSQNSDAGVASTANTNRISHPSNNRLFFGRKDNRIITSQPAAQDANNGRKSPPDRIGGKLDRLYNGLPTSGNSSRDKALNQAASPAGMVQCRQQQAPPSPSRMNQVLRRAMSRDALKKEQESRKSFGALSSQRQIQERETPGSPVINRRSSQPVFPTNYPAASKRLGDQHLTIETETCTSITEDGSDNDADVDDSNRDHDGNEDEEEDEDEFDEEEEEEIIFTPEQDKTSKPFEVSLHQAPSTDDDTGEDEEDGRNTPVSDNETQIKAEEEDDGSSEDNVDDAINRDIVAREPPRVSTSISRTSSSVNGNRRRSALFDTATGRSSCDLILPSSPPDDQDSKGAMNGTATSNTAFKEIQKKLQKAAKRQSITARFLSSLTKSDGSPGSSSSSRPSLDHIMSSFQDISNTAKPEAKATTLPLPLASSRNTNCSNTETSNMAIEKMTIDVAPPIPFVETKELPVAAVVQSGLIKEEVSALPPPPPQDDSRTESALADLDGASVLLDSVLEMFESKLKLPNGRNEKTTIIIEDKLNQIALKISKTLQQKKSTSAIDQVTNAIPSTAPETIDLLEKYSTLLLNMVESKLNK